MGSGNLLSRRMGKVAGAFGRGGPIGRALAACRRKCLPHAFGIEIGGVHWCSGLLPPGVIQSAGIDGIETEFVDKLQDAPRRRADSTTILFSSRCSSVFGPVAQAPRFIWRKKVFPGVTVSASAGNCSTASSGGAPSCSHAQGLATHRQRNRASRHSSPGENAARASASGLFGPKTKTHLLIARLTDFDPQRAGLNHPNRIGHETGQRQ